MEIALHLISNIGKEVTFNKLKNVFGLGSANTASDYLRWMEDAYLFFYLGRFSWSSKQVAANPRKVYAVDNGLINANSKSFSKDLGRLLENWVFLELRRKTSYTLYYFKEKNECDFVVIEDRVCTKVIQVCWEINSDNQSREINGLLEAMRFFNLSEGFIVTNLQQDELEYDGLFIHLVPAHLFSA